jgi:hypothetical protein
MHWYCLIALYAGSNSTRKSYEHFRSDDSLNSREYACCMRLECNPSEFSTSAINDHGPFLLNTTSMFSFELDMFGYAIQGFKLDGYLCIT